jgi:hypothetical protein
MPSGKKRVQSGPGRRMGILLIAAGLLALASAPAALGADRIYWGNGGNDTISYANLDGSGGGGQLNLSGATPSGPRGVVIDSAAGRIYWANQVNNTISYANLDGSGGGGELNISGTTPSKPHGLAIYPATGIIYWANDNDTISYAYLDGSGGGQLNISGATPSSPYGAAIDPAGGRIYWANRTTNTISYANLDNSGGGGELDTSSATPNDPHGVVIDPAAGRIYWANVDSTIFYANLDGSGGGALNLSGASERGGVGLGIDPTTGRIYWGNLGSWTISYADLDNSGGGGILNISGATSNQPRFVALLRAPSGAGAPQIAGDATPGSVLTCSQGTWAPDVLASFLYRAPRSLAYQWTRNGAEIAGATDATYTAFVQGDYRCRQTATNDAGSTSQTSDPHTVSGPPDTKLTQAKMNSLDHKARFKFKAMGEATGFQCKLKRSDEPALVKGCSSPMTYKHLQPGRYLFEVRASGPGGTDPTPVEKRLTIQ